MTTKLISFTSFQKSIFRQKSGKEPKVVLPLPYSRTLLNILTLVMKIYATSSILASVPSGQSRISARKVGVVT